MTRRPRTPMTPVIYEGPRGNLRNGRAERWNARSKCGTWSYHRLEDRGTPWMVIHHPTGHVEWFGSLRSARVWTVKPDAIESIRRQAQDVIDAGGKTGGYRVVEDLSALGGFRKVSSDTPESIAEALSNARRVLAALPPPPPAVEVTPPPPATPPRVWVV